MDGEIDFTEFPLGEYEGPTEPGWPYHRFRVAYCPKCVRPGVTSGYMLGKVFWHRRGDPGRGWRSREGRDFCVIMNADPPTRHRFPP
jgi:hypothetical protein